jgi:hypothetical protein
VPYSIKVGSGPRKYKIVNRQTGKQVGSSVSRAQAESAIRARLAGAHGGLRKKK